MAFNIMKRSSGEFNRGKMTPGNKRDERLVNEFYSIEELCNKTSKIDFEVLESNKRGIPEKYKIFYKNIKSITGIKEDESPIYAMNHEAQITYPKNFPGGSHPQLYMVTDTWHPNIKSQDPGKGRICINAKEVSKYHGIDDLIRRVGEILQYKNYWAVELPPYPEDFDVAKWVREYAEPHGIVNYQEGKVLDESSIMDSDDPQTPAGETQTAPPPEEEEEDDIIIDFFDDEPAADFAPPPSTNGGNNQDSEPEIYIEI